MIKKTLLKIYYWSSNSPERTDYFQKIARDCEWEAVREFIKIGNFLDVGCGAGYAMILANKLGCEAKGIDPYPMEHGVGRRQVNFQISANDIIIAKSEQIPFPDNSFDTLFSSHVLEHVDNMTKSLQEMNRVVSPDGIIIIGVPSSSMAMLSWFSQLIFVTHQNIVNVLFRKFIKTGKTKWWEIFIPRSHSFPNKTIWVDVKNYKENKWKKVINNELNILQIIRPCFYSFPQYKQLFPLRKSGIFSSSIFFICSKKNI